MKTGKFVSRMIVLPLVFFITTTGAAQALNISKCQGECCQNTQKRSHHKGSAHRLSVHPSIEFKSIFLLCDPLQQIRALEENTPQQQNCHHGTVPPCCRLAQANNEIEGLISTALSRAYRSLEIGPVSISSEIHATDYTFNTASERYSLPARATPAPIYLKNSTFLC
jgi:hypothetical protein